MVFGFAVAVFSFALIVVVFGFAVAVFSFALIVVVFGFAVAVFGFALIVTVFGFAVAVFGFAYSSKGLLRVVVAAPGHGGREIGLWREIICNFNLLRSALQAMHAPPRHTAPMGFPSFQSRPKSQNKTKQTRGEESPD